MARLETFPTPVYSERAFLDNFFCLSPYQLVSVIANLVYPVHAWIREC